MKRFYKEVSLSAVDGSSFEILLDQRPVRTPLRSPLQVPGKALAGAIADEWSAQEETIDVDMMPFTRIAATALDRVRSDRSGYTDQIAAFAETDLVCYRAPAPSGLVLLQSRRWQPLLDWSHDTFGAMLKVTEGISPVTQNPEDVRRLRDALDAHDEFELAALSVATAASGSLIIALALARKHIDAEAAFEACQLDESYQNAIWGVDPEAERRREILRDDIEASARFLALLRAG